MRTVLFILWCCRCRRCRRWSWDELDDGKREVDGNLDFQAKHLGVVMALKRWDWMGWNVYNFSSSRWLIVCQPINLVDHQLLFGLIFFFFFFWHKDTFEVEMRRLWMQTIKMRWLRCWMALQAKRLAQHLRNWHLRSCKKMFTGPAQTANQFRCLKVKMARS